ncbi:hypothetical protein D3C78_1800470 [compost metagenome]
MAQTPVAMRLPVVRPRPTVRTQIQANFDVEVLCQELLERAVRPGAQQLELILQPLGAD